MVGRERRLREREEREGSYRGQRKGDERRLSEGRRVASKAKAREEANKLAFLPAKREL